MAKLLRLRRGTDTQHTTFTGAEGEVTVNTTNDSLHVHDGTTAGGRELARADLSNVSGTTEGGITVNGNLSLADSNKARFGTGNDLEIYHDGSNSHIADAGTGNLLIRGQEVQIGNAAGSRILLQTNSDAASVTLYNDTTARLATTNTGIDVTGTVTCDGANVDGQLVVAGGDEFQLIVKDVNSSGTAAETALAFTDSVNATLGYAGFTNPTTDVYEFLNLRNGGMRFGTNNTWVAEFQSNGHFVPYTSNSYDLGTNSLQWRDAYFDGTVNCDGLTCEGVGVFAVSGDPQIVCKDSDSSGNSALASMFFRDSNNTNLGYIGYASAANSDVWLTNIQNANINFATNNTTRMILQNGGHLCPAANNSYDLGESANRWRNVYTNDLNLSNEGGANDVDGTWGSWTIQEGEDDLFLLNRRNGKKYKFNLSEVN